MAPARRILGLDLARAVAVFGISKLYEARTKAENDALLKARLAEQPAGSKEAIKLLDEGDSK